MVVGCWASRSEGWTRCSLRALLYERANERVVPYDITVAEFTSRTVELKNRLAMCGIKDEGIIVPLSLGAENRTNSNILLANTDSLSHGDGTSSGPRGTMTPPSL